jgi:5'-3' exonuclease
MLVLLVDGLNLIRRIDAAVPGEEGASEHGEAVLESSARSLARALERLAPTHALCAFEGAGRSWRHELLPGYKAGRPAMPAGLAAMLPRIEAAFAAAGVRPVRLHGFEADDVLATVAVKVAGHGGQSVILSTDKSMLTLLGPGIRVRDHFRDRELDATYVRERFGVDPHDLTTYLALVGDSSQKVPGVRSVGAKTAARLIAEHGTLEAILAAAQGMAGRLGEALRAGADDARLSLRLVRLDTGVEVGLNLSECRIGQPAHLGAAPTAAR